MAAGNKVALQAGQTLGADTGGTDSTRAFDLGAVGTGEGGLAGLAEFDRGAGVDFRGLETAGAGGFAAVAVDAATPAATGWRAGAEPISMARLHFGHSTCLPAELSGTCIA